MAVMLASGLDAVKAESNLEKRAKLALDYANDAIDASRKAYSTGDMDATTAGLDQVREAAEVCLEALTATGKDARRNPRPFKRAELRINELLRRLKSLETDFGAGERAAVEKTQQRLLEIHDDLISRIMSKHK